MRAVNRQEFEAGLRPRLISAMRAVTESIEPASLRGAVDHLLGSGKLFRPLLALATLRAISGSDESEAPSLEQCILPSCALELVHTFTLIHDDLPCMDDAQLRRGLPAVHIAYDEALAVLAGDDLLTKAFWVLGLSRALLPADAILDLMQHLAGATHLVVQGQVEDIEGEDGELQLEALKALHSRKTGALIAASCAFGASFCGMRGEPVRALKEIGRDIGLAFQIRDDLLSLESSEEQMGKTLHTDVSKKKSTYPRLLGVEGARNYARDLVAGILARIDALGLKESGLLKEYAALALSREQ